MKKPQGVEQISQADAARAKGVTAGAVSLACREGGPLFPAMLPGKRLNRLHPAYIAWLAGESRRPSSARAPTRVTKVGANVQSQPTGASRELDIQPAPPPKGRRGGARIPPQPSDSGSPEDMQAIADTLRPLLDRFGSERAFRDWLVAQKDVETIIGKQLENDETKGLLIPRELVKVHVFGAIEASNRRLLGDSAKTIARRIYSMAKGGARIEDAEATVRDIIGSQLKPVKATASRVLRRTEVNR